MDKNLFRSGKIVPVFLLAAAVFSISILTVNAQISSGKVKPRIVITTDPELDDSNSLIRFLLYSTDVEIEGLVYASSQFHWKGDGKGTRWYVPGREYDRFGMNECPCESWRWSENSRHIHDVVEAYEKVYPNLIKHNPDYPSPEYLKSKIRYGNIEFDGDISKDSPGSDLIKSLILDDRPGKLFLAAWGGHSTIARALKSIQEQYEYTTEWEALKKKISRKVVLLPSGDQDDTYAKYIKPNWPDIEYRQFRGGPNYGYGAQIKASPEDAAYMTPEWMKENITSRGPLGELYRVWGDGKQMVKGDRLDYFGLSGYTDEQLRKMGYIVWMPVQKKGSWLGEGDNHTFMNMLDNGLRAWEKGYYGGWGGRVIEVQEETGFPPPSPGLSASKMDYPDFFPQAQRDFANRLKWSVTDKYENANHEPVVTVEGPLEFLASPGQRVAIHGRVSDPDGNKVAVKWWQFNAGTYPGKVDISHPDSLKTYVTIPRDAAGGQTIHIILEATDNGEPPLTRYQRIIITIR
ncbi:MAG TPA: DUF1593 domain-containing protein [Bacteroidales bacterium]|nr:DUF1593 domain-containing protein [Bacteroidales bacterium]HRR16840.1 DUF1593 domain-containing protein [Bacteroidales bacterium]HRU57021.1 DUF1593 domain-containing protein [Bacteroidales bacterium]